MSKMKICKRCGAIKPIEGFYRHPAMKDGYLNQCRECMKGRARERRRENGNEVKRAARDRRRDDYSKQSIMDRKYRDAQKLKPEYADQRRERGRKRTPEQKRAYNAVQRNIRGPKPIACQGCGQADTKLVAHHEDYSRPMDVIWLCERCHMRLHSAMRRLPSVGYRFSGELRDWIPLGDSQ